MAEQAGPQMKRVVIDGHEYLLPVDAVVSPGLTPDSAVPADATLGGCWK